MLLALTLALADGASAQAELRPGTRLRITVVSPSVRAQFGSFEALNDTALVVSSDAASRMIPLRDISRLEWSSGRRLSRWGGAVGLVVGAAAGGLVACSANRDSYGVFCAGQNDTKIAVGAVLGGITGGALGAYLFRRDQWTPVDLGRLQGRSRNR